LQSGNKPIRRRKKTFGAKSIDKGGSSNRSEVDSRDNTEQKSPYMSVKKFTARKKTVSRKTLIRRTPRESAVFVISKWLRSMVRIDFLVDDIIGKYGWSQKDKNLFYELVYGTVKWQGRLQWILNQLTDRFDNNPETARAAAYIGVYQLLFLDRVPDFAVVHSIVEIVKDKHDQATAGWINALLRRICRETEIWTEILPETTDRFEKLSVEYSFPDWMIERWSKQLDKDQLREFLGWNNRSPEVVFRINTQQADLKKVIGFLEKDEIAHRVSEFDPSYIILKHSGNISKVESVRKGLVVVQDHAQGIPAILLDPQPGEIILDLCSAPGGKSGHLAELCPQAEIIATDKSEDRLIKVNDLVDRCQYDNLKVKQYQEILSSSTKYDAILIDAPCTGTGVMARRPDLRWRQAPGDAKKMAGIQRQLLRYASERLKIGGRIVYSTCSVEQEENEVIVDEFLSQHSNYNVADGKSKYFDKEYCKNGRIRVFGPEIKGDGIFAVVMRRLK